MGEAFCEVYLEVKEQDGRTGKPQSPIGKSAATGIRADAAALPGLIFAEFSYKMRYTHNV